jgi:MFS family permease
MLAILSFLNFLNYIDRGIIAPLVPLLQKPEASGGMGLNETQVGLLTTAFMIVHSVASVPLGVLGDRWSRKLVIAGGVGLWSVATAAAGIVRGYGQLFVARAAVGIGEAAYAPAATAMISERFPAQARSKAMGIFQVGMILGGGVAIIVGGWVGQHWGWRAAFLVVGGPGVLLAGLVLLLAETRRRRPKPGEPRPSGSVMIDVTSPGSLPAAIWVCLTGVFITFFVGAYMQWSVAFVLRYHYAGDTRSLAEVTSWFGLIAISGSVLGALSGSVIADRFERSRPGIGRLLTIAIGVAAAVPTAFLGTIAETKWLLYPSLWVAVYFASWYAGPILAALHDVVPPHRRAAATGIYLLAVHLLGDAISPPIVGFIARRPWGSLQIGLLLTLVVLAAAIPAAFIAMRGSRQVAKLKHPDGPR